MVYPYTLAARISQYPYRHVWHESIHTRMLVYSALFFCLPVVYMINKRVTSPQNRAFWKEKRKHDAEHHRKELEKIWEVRT